MATDRPGALAAIGNTPVARLGRLIEPGTGFVPLQLSLDEVDVVAAVSSADAFAMARRVATIQVDPGLTYLAGELYT